MYRCLYLLGLIFFISFTASTSFSPSLAAEKVRFGTSLKDAPHFDLTAWAAEEKGFWKQENLEATWFPFKGSGDMFRAFAAGAMDIAMSETASAIQVISRGLPVVIVADLEFKQYFSLWVLPTSHIKGPRDLKGAKIGISRKGGAAHAYGIVMAKGLGLEQDVTFVTVGGVSERVAALKSGATDTFVQTFAPIATLVDKGELREVVSVKEFLPKEWTDIVVVARKDFAGKDPEVVRKGARAVIRAANFVQDNRAWAVEKLKSKLGYEEKAAESVHAELRFGKDGKVNVKALENVVNFLAEYGIIAKEKAPKVDALYDRSFVQ